MDKRKLKKIKEFLYIFTIIFVFIGIYPLFKNNDIRFWSLSIALLIINIAIFKPIVMSPFYDFWIKLGEFIGGIVSKIIMFLLYFTVFTPFALFLKIFGKDLLNKKIDQTKSTYWIDKEMQPQSMKNQF